jgi:hypothetical protein
MTGVQFFTAGHDKWSLKFETEAIYPYNIEIQEK